MRRTIVLAIATLLVVAVASIAIGSAASINVTSRKLTQFTAAGPTTSTTTPPGDTTPPALTSLELRDPNNDGVAEIVEATFNEPIACEGGTCATTPWGTTGTVPSGGALSTVTVSGSKATLTFAGTNKNTAVDSLAIALSNTGTGRIQDAAGNKASFVSTAPTDKARPVPIALATTNGNGITEAGDTLTVTFSETISASGYPKTVAVRIEDPEGQGNDLLSIASFTDGALDAGSDGYQKQNNDYHEFGGSQLTVSGTTVTATVAGVCSHRNKGCSNIAAGQGSFNFRPSPSITDSAGNTAAGSLSLSATFRIF